MPFFQVTDLILGPSGISALAGVFLVASIVKSIGILFFGAVYNILNPAKASNHYYFKPQNVAGHAAVNLTAWIAYLIGRMIISFAVYGPTVTMLGMKYKPMKDLFLGDNLG